MIDYANKSNYWTGVNHGPNVNSRNTLNTSKLRKYDGRKIVVMTKLKKSAKNLNIVENFAFSFCTM